MKKIIIAIDGFSSTGKSTLSKQIAQKLQYKYIDTGAMYRAITYFALKNNYIQDTVVDAISLQNVLPNIQLELKPNNNQFELFLNNENIEPYIRSLTVANYVSEIAKLDFVRKYLVNIQREWGKEKGIVMDGRDIGTVVFPQAEIKFFITASPEVRAKRRYNELINKGETVLLEEITENIQKRDYIDSHRAIAPLKPAEDAIIIDNSSLTKEEQLIKILEYITKIIE